MACELPALLKHHFRTAVCESLGELQELCESLTPAVVVLDRDSFPADQHSAAEMLAHAKVLSPQRLTILISSDEYGVGLNGSSRAEHLAIVPRPLDLPALAERLMNLAAGNAEASTTTIVPPPPAAAVPVSPAPRITGSETTLRGVTREFETNTLSLRDMLQDLEIAARHNVTILLIGETGTGKTYLAKLIHEISPRHAEPFLTVACGALPSELIESELFGHVKGAFTSAHADKEGKFIAAGRGTILLDEIDALEPEQQVKLLRVIETGEFEPVGSNRTLKSQARLVVASNVDLRPLVEKGQFRRDLYYRLNMLGFNIPPLRERPRDIVPLATKFIRQMSERHHIEVEQVDDDFLRALEAYSWPGNVRELENVVQRAVIYCRGRRIEASLLPRDVLHQTRAGGADESAADRSPAHGDLGQRMACSERDIIEQALSRNHGSRTKTARDLGISRVTLYNKMKKHGLL